MSEINGSVVTIRPFFKTSVGAQNGVDTIIISCKASCIASSSVSADAPPKMICGISALLLMATTYTEGIGIAVIFKIWIEIPNDLNFRSVFCISSGREP